MSIIRFLPSGKVIKARTGQTLIQAARAARVVIPQRCGGHASCQMCKIIVEEGELLPPTPLERRKLREEDLAAGVRLSCQARVGAANCCVRLPESKLKLIVASLLAKQQEDE